MSIFTRHYAPAKPSNTLRIEPVGGTMTSGANPLLLGARWRIAKPDGAIADERLFETRYSAHREAAWLARSPLDTPGRGWSMREGERLMATPRDQMRAIILVKNQHPPYGGKPDHRLWVEFFLNDPSARPEQWGHCRVDSLFDASPYDVAKMLQLLAWGLDGEPVLVLYEVNTDQKLQDFGEGVGFESLYREDRVMALNSRDKELGHTVMNRMRELQYHLCREQYDAFTGKP